MFLELIGGKTLGKQFLVEKFEVSPKTISRYIMELNCFFSNFYLPYNVSYCYKNKGYQLYGFNKEKL